jgi:hypothetical protein
MTPENNLLTTIHRNRLTLLPKLGLWRAEIQAQADLAHANPSYTLGKLLGYISEICSLPASYSVEETKTANGYYCKIILPENCTFVNEVPSETPINAMIISTSMAVGAILGACFKDDQEPNVDTDKRIEQDKALEVIDENTIMTEATATKTKTTPAQSLPNTTTNVTAVSTSISRPAPMEVASSATLSKKRKLEEVETESEDKDISPGGSYFEKLIGEGPDGQPLIERTHAQINLTEFSYRGLFAYITSSMKWIIDHKHRQIENNQVESTLIVDPRDGHLPWVICESRPSERAAREGAMKRFFQLLTEEGIIKVSAILPPVEHMKDYASNPTYDDH